MTLSGRRLAGREAQDVDRPRLSLAVREHQVRRDVLGGHAAVQDAGGRAMQRRPGGRRGPLVDRPAQEGMAEAQRRGRVEQIRVLQRGGAARRRRSVESGQESRGVHLRLAGQHRDRCRQRRAVGSEAGERRRDAVPDRSRADRPDPTDVELVPRRALGGERVQQLPQQERIAARLLHAGLDERIGAVARTADEHCARGGAEGTRLQDPDVASRGQLCDQLGLRPGVAGAGSGDDDDREVLDPRGELDQEPDRERVGPVQVVDDERERLLATQVLHETLQGVDERRLAVGAERAPDPLASEQHRGDQCGAAPEQPRLLGLGGGVQPVLEQPQHDPEGEVALQDAAARPQDHHLLGAGELRRRGEQAGLAQARGRPDQRDVAAPVARAGDGRGQCAELRVAFEQRPFGDVRGPISRHGGHVPGDGRPRRPVPPQKPRHIA